MQQAAVLNRYPLQACALVGRPPVVRACSVAPFTPASTVYGYGSVPM